jgi:hypothetical protein
VGRFAVTDDSEEAVVDFEPDIDLLLDLLVDTAKKDVIYEHASIKSDNYLL